MEGADTWRPFHDGWARFRSDVPARKPARPAPKPSKKLVASVNQAMRLAGEVVSAVDLRTVYELRAPLIAPRPPSVGLAWAASEIRQLHAMVAGLKAELDALKENARSPVIAASDDTRV